MDKNKKKLIKFSAIMLSPFMLTVVLIVLKYAVWRAIPFWVAVAPIWLVILAIVVFMLLLRYYSWRYHELHGRKCCGTCCQCMEDVYHKGPGKCLVDGSEIKDLARHSCNMFFGSVMKGYEG